jgi:hypothetical protein
MLNTQIQYYFAFSLFYTVFSFFSGVNPPTFSDTLVPMVENSGDTRIRLHFQIR